MLTVDEIKEKVTPVAKKYDVPIVYLFGSYARGEASSTSDVDLAYRGENSKAKGSKKFAFQRDIEHELGMEIDLLRVENFDFSFNKDKDIVGAFNKERIVIYEKE